MAMAMIGCLNEEHLKNLSEVLNQMQETGLCLKKEKCEFMSSSVVYLGHHIDAQGIHLL